MGKINSKFKTQVIQSFAEIEMGLFTRRRHELLAFSGLTLHVAEFSLLRRKTGKDENHKANTLMAI